MSPSIIREVQLSGLHGADMAVALTIAIEADNSRCATISLPDLCRWSGFKRKAVTDAIRRLESMHYIRVFPPSGRRQRRFMLKRLFGP